MADKQLEQLNKEISDLNAKVEAAEIDWLSATEPQRKADLKDMYDYAKKKMEQTLPHLLEDRRALLASLLGAGERTELLQSLHAISPGLPCRLTASITAACCGPRPRDCDTGRSSCVNSTQVSEQCMRSSVFSLGACNCSCLESKAWPQAAAVLLLSRIGQRGSSTSCSPVLACL